MTASKTHIIIHHSATIDGETFSWGAIRRYHMNVKGWRDIGYHFGIEEIGGRHEVLFGRWPGERGAHTLEMNLNELAFGICCVGNFDVAPPPPGMMDKLTALCRWLMETYRIPADYVLGHHEAQECGGTPQSEWKTCPGKQFDMVKFRADLKAHE